jgi:hypothetical protein
VTAVPAWLRILVAGWPAVAFLGGTLLAHTTPTRAEPASEPAEPPVEPDQQPQAPELPPANLSALPVPAALVEHARKLALDHRARTGTAIDTPTLRARLGVPTPLAEAIAAQL